MLNKGEQMMQQWEYSTLQGWKETMGFQWTNNMGETLNRMGDQGWELVAIVEAQKNLVQWVFKRPLSQVHDMPSARDYPTHVEQRIA
jgi:hypothetical protein